MARRKVILPNWSANEVDSKSIEMLGAEFSGLTQGELVINTNVDNTLLSTLNEGGKVVVFESSEMIDKRLEGFLDKVHQHDNYDVLSAITSGMIDTWNSSEENAITSAKSYTDEILSGYTTKKYVDDAVANVASVPGEAATITGVTAQYIESATTPVVTVNPTGTENERGFEFSFGGLMGPRGLSGTSAYIEGATASIDPTTGVPQVIVTSGGNHSNISFDFAFSGLKGADGKDGIGIKSFVKTSGNGSAGNTDEYTLTFTNDVTSAITVYNGNNGQNGITPEFTSITATVNNTTGTPNVFVSSSKTEGEKYSLVFNFDNLKGEKGEDGTSVKILGEFSSESELKATITNPSNGDGYIIGKDLFIWDGEKWKNVGEIKGPKGDSGVGISTITKISGNSQPGETDTYKITLTDNSTYTFDVYNGVDGKNGDSGVGISAITKVKGNSQPGETDTYAIKLTNGNSANTFTVYNGDNGDNGNDGFSIFYINTITTEQTLEAYKSTIIPNNINPKIGDLILSKAGLLYSITYVHPDKVSVTYLTSLIGPTGTFDDSKLNEYVRTDNIDYTNAVNNSHSHGNKAVLDGITSGMINSWTNAESNAIATASAYTDNQIKLVVNGATDAFDTLKEVQTWIENHSGKAETMIASINAISGVAHSHKNYAVLSGITEDDTTKWNTAFRKVRVLDNSIGSELMDVNASDSEDLYIIGKNGIKVSKFISSASLLQGINISAPHITFTASDSVTKYPLIGNSGYSIFLSKFLTINGNYSETLSGHAAVSLSVNTGTDENSVALGNHNHNGTYSPIITQSSGSSTYYLLGVASKSANTVTEAYVSSTDIYMQGGEIYAASDETLKNFGKNIEVGFDKLAEIPKVYYTWKTDADNKQQIGTSAQKLKEIYPELVSENEDGKMAVSYEKLSIIALAAVDKLHKENEELKDRLKRIEEKLGL